MKKIISVLISMCLALILILVITPNYVSASAGNVFYAKNVGIGLTEQQVKKGAFYRMYLPEEKMDNGKIIKVSSGNKKMITQVEIYKNSVFTFNIKNYGKTTFTIVVKTGKNKLKKYKCNFSVVKYNCPVSSVRLGTSENFASKFKNDISFQYKRVPESDAEKISIKPKSGWKLTSIRRHFYYDQKEFTETVKNNSVIEYYESDQIYIDLKNKRNGMSQTLAIYISREPIIYEN